MKSLLLVMGLIAFLLICGCVGDYQQSSSQPQYKEISTPVHAQYIEKTVITNTNPRTAAFRYTVKGKTEYLNMDLYDSIYQYVWKNAPYDAVDIKDWSEKRREIEIQNIELDSLVSSIKEKSVYRDDEARIAISLVQNIPYAEPTGRTYYEVLYEKKGACGEKSELLAYILNKLGYDAVLLDFPESNHMAVGIKSPQQYSYQKSGYAFIETTEISVPTYSNGDYYGIGKLSKNFSIIRLSEQNRSFSTIFDEAVDAAELDRIQNGRFERNDENLMMHIFTKYGIPTSEPTSVQVGQLIYYYY